MEKKNCHGCRFALELDWKGDVRCAKAEEMFGGKRVVKFKEEATCGQFESFVGDDSRAPDLAEEKPVIKVTCGVCKGTGFTTIQFIGMRERVKCPHCVHGKIVKEEN
ncbi:hypothetical protein CN367_11895 [Priestia megaterium]|uniref:hypothetical protein n=1 Tax=Priestia megaterium TaxID=1404 RepID=UPI000BFA5C31|nr:hypothetical protein [Priestia megaterium]PEZ47061.1 hypothetical protein CN367_11895 [Priestia megaterium]